ncbi:hypothetical protein [Pyxidicoccus sp. MSG2]|uniref:hypothetical protein n=1 Tax=Pyxidicoccus sp. MSG2 TaxID=2996790 RepID=UPI00226EF183|nr:hypothetical protein [Pyxidicoccus sp. MSG2]MCY1016368.1 hypothetical protein [Pyxidicoccus sp. MSG2]
MRFRTVLPLLLALCTCRGPAPREATRPGGESRTHVWVDAAGRVPGDGTREQPLRSLAEALIRPGPLTVHLGAGTYAGPFTLPEGVRLEGLGPASVLSTEGAEAPVLRAGRDAALVDLEVRGGGWGLEVGGGRVRVERVGFSGQRTGAVRVEAGRLEVESGRFEATVPGTTGVLLEGAQPEAAGGAEAGTPRASGVQGEPPEPAPRAPIARAQAVEARITASAFTGPYRRAVRVRGAGARVELADVKFSGPDSAVGVDAGHADVRHAVAEGGKGSAFSVVDGALILEDVRVTGHEYGLSATRARTLEVRRFTSVRAERAGLGVVGSRGVLEDVVVRDSGDYGGLQLVGGDLQVQRFRVEGSAEYGLSALHGRLRLRDGTILRVRSADGSAGDGLQLREVEADVEGVVVREVAGSCVLAAQAAHVKLRDAELSGCRYSGLAVDTQAWLEATGVVIDGAGAAMTATGQGELRVDGLTASGLGDGLVWADCQGNTRVSLERVRSEDARGLPTPCVAGHPEKTAAPR